MRALLDTHAFLWLVGDPGRLGRQRSFIEDAAHELFVSAASSWEISIKHALGRLQLSEPPARFVPRHLREAGLTGIAVEHSHALHAGSLPNHHRDPFDRLLIAQAMELRIPILSADPAFDPYDVDVLHI